MHIYFDIILGSIIGTVSYFYFYIKRERNLHPQRTLDQKTNFYLLKSTYEKYVAEYSGLGVTTYEEALAEQELPVDVLDNLSEADSEIHSFNQKMNRNNSCKNFKINHIKKQQLNNQYKSNQRIQQIRPRIRANI